MDTMGEDIPTDRQVNEDMQQESECSHQDVESESEDIDSHDSDSSLTYNSLEDQTNQVMRNKRRYESHIDEEDEEYEESRRESRRQSSIVDIPISQSDLKESFTAHHVVSSGKKSFDVSTDHHQEVEVPIYQPKFEFDLTCIISLDNIQESLSKTYRLKDDLESLIKEIEVMQTQFEIHLDITEVAAGYI